jgi:hypothetical protein
MTTQVPCVFESWKAVVFEKRADKIHELISSGNVSITSPNRSDLKSFEGTFKQTAQNAISLSGINGMSPDALNSVSDKLKLEQVQSILQGRGYTTQGGIDEEGSS